MSKTISIIGAGSMGTSMAVLLSGNGHKVSLWSPFADEIEMLETNREHTTRLPGIKIDKSVLFSIDIEKTVAKSDLIVLALPSQTIRDNMKNMKPFAGENPTIVCCSKGIEVSSKMILSDVISQELPGATVVALSGPSHAEEIAQGIPTAVVAASLDQKAALFVQDVFMSEMFRVYTNSDILGVELGGAIKNVIALCAGISDGLAFGDNTKAALMTRGIAEIARLGMAMGAQMQTFYGLTGIGDLIVTCTSMHSRNRRAGILMGQGKTPDEAVNEVKMVVEGIATAKPAFELSEQFSVEMPITEQAYRIIYEGKDPRQAVVELMTRDRKVE